MKNCKHLRELLVLSAAATLLALGGCAPKTTVVLVADPDGKTGLATVVTDGGAVDLSRHGEATVVSERTASPTEPRIYSDEKITSLFGDVLKAMPEKPEHFLLYFEKGSTELSTESTHLIPTILEMITARGAQKISVIGHSDTAGEYGFNLRLSKERAEAVKQLLVNRGVAEAQIETTSHGEENPLIPTADNVSEPRNRRVEVVVR